MVRQDYLAGAVEGCYDSGQLDQHVAAILSVLYHALHRFQMAACPGEAVQYRFRVLVTVFVPVFMHMVMVV
jgi:hypothetical protein